MKKAILKCTYKTIALHLKQNVTRKVGDVTLEGANPSAEEMEEGSEVAYESGVDLVLNHKLQDMTGIYTDLKNFKDWIKEYIKK